MVRIVVGVDGSPNGQAALAFALEEARLRGATLVAVHAWRIPLYEGVPGPFVLELPAGASAPALAEARERLAADAEAVLARALAEALEGRQAPVPVERAVLEAPPAAALLDAARGAALLVVGSRGRGRLGGLLLGSVSQQCALHAPCPVAIVPAPAD